MTCVCIGATQKQSYSVRKAKREKHFPNPSPVTSVKFPGSSPPKTNGLSASSLVRSAFGLFRILPSSLGVRRACYRHVCVVAIFWYGTPARLLGWLHCCGQRGFMALLKLRLGLRLKALGSCWLEGQQPGFQWVSVHVT